MRHLIILLAGGLLLACGSESGTTDPENNLPSDSTGGADIVEYELNEERLSAVDFNNDLTFIQQGALDQINLLFQSDSANVRVNFDNALFDIGLKLVDLKQKDIAEGGEDFQGALVNLLSFYETELNEGFEPLLPVLEKSADERTGAEEEMIKEFDLNFAEKEAELFEAILNAQEAFAKANNIRMSDVEQAYL